MAHLTNEQASKVFNLLVRDYGVSEHQWAGFRKYFTRECFHDHEYRFMGIFGMGGKLRLDNYSGLTADYYYESQTPELDKKMETLNSSLNKLWIEFKLTT